MSTQREQPLLTLPQPEPGPLPERHVVGQGGHRRRGGIGIAHREEQAVLADRLDVGTPVRRHHRQSVGHGLDHREPERLGRRRGQQDRRGIEQPVGVLHQAHELDRVPDPEPGDQIVHRGASITHAGDDQPPTTGSQPAGRPGPEADFGDFSEVSRCSIRTVADSSGAWGCSSTPLGSRTHGPSMLSATNRLMAMSRATTRLVTRAKRRATVPVPRSPGKWRVATIGARCTGWASQAAASAAVMWTCTTEAVRCRASATATCPTEVAGWWGISWPSSARIRSGSPPMATT